MSEPGEVRGMRNAEAGHVISRSSSITPTGERLKIERLTSRSEGSGWKSTRGGNSLAAYPTARCVLRGLGEGDLAWLPGAGMNQT
jgi:hypothetical protein